MSMSKRTGHTPRQRGPSRKEQRRIQLLAEATARGDRQARVNWLLSYDREFDGYERMPVDGVDIHRHAVPDDPDWAAKPVTAYRCRVSLLTVPPAMAEQFQSLCGLYLTDDGWPYHADNVTEDGLALVVAYTADRQRWHRATLAYLRELAAVHRNLWRYWDDYGRRLGVAWGRSAPLRAWQDRLRSGYEQLARASDAYRPIFAEIDAAIAETAKARQALEARQRDRRAWEERRLWYLRITQRSVTIARADVTSKTPPDTTVQSLRDAYAAAKTHYDTHLVPVDWHEASLRACDDELAQLAAAHPPVGQSHSGGSLLKPSPATFAEWFRRYAGVAHDRLSDRHELGRLRQRRNQAQNRPPGQPHGASGAWPTSFGIGDSGGGYGAGGYFGGGGF
jgi:hypothetical protein